LNSELLNEGIGLELKGEAAAPIVLIYVSTKAGDQFAANYRLQITCTPNSKATVVEVHHSPALTITASQIVSQVDVGQNASVTYVKVQNGAEAQHLGHTKFILARDSRLESTQVSLGGTLVRQNLQVKFSDRGAEAIVNGLYLASGSEHIDNQTLIDHVVGNTTSAQLYKGILDGEARGVFTGGVRIRKDAQLANSSQLNNNLMLSQKAEIDTKPELEIEADDVKAAHGATIGQINPDHIFYLQSRALSKKQAVAMLAFGFAQDIVDRISDESVRGELSLLVKHKFSQFKVESI
jgi:Fe-S cluster assembly protein SufD